MQTEPEPESTPTRRQTATPEATDRFRVLQSTDVDLSSTDDFAGAVLQGLSESPKQLPSRFLYDDEGSEYFRRIMASSDYYPTRCEAEILTTHVASILFHVSNEPFHLVDLGAGDGAKTLILLRHLAEQNADATYVPIDISPGAMETLAGIVKREVPTVAMQGLVATYSTALQWLGQNSEGRRNLVLFLGSNIGNFNRANARAFLRQLWSGLNHGDYLLIGFDLKKDIDLLLRAYNDSEGVTAQFNLNLLRRINRELGGNFDVDTFRHYATYDVFSGAMESYLVSLVEQSVAIDALHSEFTFDAWEPVHTEYSYKYLESDIEGLARDTGFVIETAFYERNRWFVDSLWRVEKPTV